MNPGIGLLEFVYIAGASWIILAFLGTAGWSFAVARYKRRCVVRIPHYPPPIEATRPRDWWDDVAEVIDEDAAADREFWSLVDGEWDERRAS